MASGDNMMNPNTQDTPEHQQVMSSPRAATGQGREVQSRTTVMNGVRPPLRGHQDLDDEVRAPGEGMGQMAHTPGTPPPGRTGGAQMIREATTNNLPGSGFLVGPGSRGQDLQAQAGTVDEVSSRGTAAQGVILTEVQGRAHVEGPNAGGVLTGVLRAVQTLPAAVEEFVNRSGSGRSPAPSAGLRESVEYASVRTSAQGSGTGRPQQGIDGPREALFDPQALERLQRMQEQAPLLYPSDSPVPPRPASTSSSDLQAEVRRQLSDMMRLRDEESRRLRAQVEALSFENQSLRLRIESGVQEGVRGSRPEGFGSMGFPSFGWLGRGLGSLIGQPRHTRAPDLGSGPSSSRPFPEDHHLAQVTDYHPHLGALEGSTLLQDQQCLPAPPPPQVPYGLGCNTQGMQETMSATQAGALPQEYSRTEGVSNPFTDKLGLTPCVGGTPGPPTAQSQASLGLGPMPKPSSPPVPPVGLNPGVLRQPTPPTPPPSGIPVSDSQAEATPGDGPEGQGLDPMSVVLTGMAQLQSVVNELASPKANEKPEVIKPGVLTLPPLPGHGPESCLEFADWLHVTKPALADISDTSERLWDLTVQEATTWYTAYLKLGPLERLTARPVPSAELSQQKWARVSRRIESMINSAAPTAIREEVSASRTSGLLPLLCKLFIIYGPGSLTERELGLKHISEPPTAAGIQEAIEGLRRWRRWCSRMEELGGVLPDSAIQVRALTKLTRQVPVPPRSRAVSIQGLMGVRREANAPLSIIGVRLVPPRRLRGARPVVQKITRRMSARRELSRRIGARVGRRVLIRGELLTQTRALPFPRPPLIRANSRLRACLLMQHGFYSRLCQPRLHLQPILLL